LSARDSAYDQYERYDQKTSVFIGGTRKAVRSFCLYRVVNILERAGHHKLAAMPGDDTDCFYEAGSSAGAASRSGRDDEQEDVDRNAAGPGQQRYRDSVAVKATFSKFEKGLCSRGSITVAAAWSLRCWMQHHPRPSMSETRPVVLHCKMHKMQRITTVCVRA
jgi:hypothetical protein